MTPPPVRMGLIGAGGFGRRLGAAIGRSTDLPLVGIVDPSAEAMVITSVELGAPTHDSVDATPS